MDRVKELAVRAVDYANQLQARDAIFEGSLEESQIISGQNGRPSIRRLNMKTEFTDAKNKVRRLSHGPTENAQRPTKTILLVGPTGSGKSTTLNALINCLLGVRYSDGHRFWIAVDEKPGEDQTKSKTRWVTCYDLYHQRCFPRGFDFNLRIIDTPGFGDTDGKERDKVITQQLSCFFNGRGREGVESLEAIALVVKGTDSRLTREAEYIFHKIMDVFGKDMAPSVLALATHCDDPNNDGNPNVLDALKLANVPYTEHFALSNTVFLRQQHDTENPLQRSMNDIIFNHNKGRYHEFLFKVASSQPRSLTQTKEQLNERLRLELRVTNLQENFLGYAMCQVETLQKQIDIFYTNEEEIKTNANFVFDEKVVEYVKESIEGFWKGATNCKKCDVTCHATCTDFGSWFFGWCYAFDGGICTVCPDNCPVSAHALEKFRLVPTTVVRKSTAFAVKARYERAVARKLSQGDVILQMIAKLEETELNIKRLVEDMVKCLQRIQQIAMRPDPMTAEDYINTLIRDERHAAREDWEIRVAHLMSVKELTNRREGDSSTFCPFSAPFQNMRRQIQAGRY